ncbi:MogA/MoaB family molybdenum cofactor biosynthesis protein [Methanothermococcus sp. Ax23]|jgi:molybdenum cofactor biosynthesis protein B|uniref:MogA/MoaB family molybdenum cofactor biosynthesis protein n=1 Tax=Methanothermococcus sp. Ax23 TaxID=3156486 RepID=UPI003B9FF18E
MHKGLENVKYAVITVSDSRFNELLSGKNVDDKSGNYLRDELNAQYYALIPDNKDMLKGLINHIIDFFDIDSIVITGGTGISNRDNTPDVLRELFEKELDGFKIVFHNLSYNEVGYATVLSRATAGIYRNKIIYALPGSLNACKTAMNIIKKETGHILKHLLD